MSLYFLCYLKMTDNKNVIISDKTEEELIPNQ